MWLDRLGQTGNSSPQSNNSRAASPLPRRTSSARGPYVTSQRSATRGSSISLLSNDSSTSLLASARRPNGSSLKQSMTAGDGGKETLEVLGTLLGSPRPPSTLGQRNPISEDDLSLAFDFSGLSLKELAKAEPKLAAYGAQRSQTVEECTSYWITVVFPS
jgi:vacuolar protein sorting-associated protein 52